MSISVLHDFSTPKCCTASYSCPAHRAYFVLACLTFFHTWCRSFNWRHAEADQEYSRTKVAPQKYGDLIRPPCHKVLFQKLLQWPSTTNTHRLISFRQISSAFSIFNLAPVAKASNVGSFWPAWQTNPNITPCPTCGETRKKSS